MAIRIGNQLIGKDQPVFIIAEACDNHLGNLDVAKQMALDSKLAGANAVKYQHHLPDEEMLPDAPMSDNFAEPLYEFLKKHALTLDQHAELMRYCKSIDMTYMCTPFSYKAAEELAELGGLDVFKIGSGEMTDIPSLVKISKLGKPMILSSGMCTIEEIDETVSALRGAGAEFALMNCVSEYPAHYEDMNLGVIQTLLDRYPDLTIGHSDHTKDLYTCFAAVALGARIIEKHIILDKLQPGPDQAVSIDMHDLHNLVDGIRKIEKASGNEKRVHHQEQQIRTWAFRSVVSVKPIGAGQTITQDMVWTKRPGTGIPSKKLAEVIGRTAVRDIQPNTLLRWEDLS
jgi:N-acetylneuraminate synthase